MQIDTGTTELLCEVKDSVALITLNRPDKKNPLTFDSYAELRDLFHNLKYASDVRAVVIQGEGGNYCSGGDVFEIIEPLTKMNTVELLDFTKMTGDVVKAMRACPHPIISAIDPVTTTAGRSGSSVPCARFMAPSVPSRPSCSSAKPVTTIGNSCGGKASV